MRLLITGASGLLGLNLAEEARSTHEVVGAHRGRLRSAPFETTEVDLALDDAADRLLDDAMPDWVINCAALANLEQCETDPERAHLLNTEFPGRLGRACSQRRIRLLHISTDAVFDGMRDGPYGEDDAPNPLGVYATTKLLGEHAVLSADSAALVARVNFYGWSLGGRRSLAEFFFENLRSGEAVNGFVDVVFCPMLVNQLARLLLVMLRGGLGGLYHVVGSAPMSKYQFGVRIARRFGLGEDRITARSVADSDLTARRSHNLTLSVHKLSTAVAGPIPSFSRGLDEFHAQYQKGYPQRIRSYAQVPV